MKLSLAAAWSELFSRHIDMSQSVNRVSAAQIKALGCEPRLMTKFDSSAARPEVLKSNGLFLLPETNGSYLVLREQGYHALSYPRPDDARIQTFVPRFPIQFESLENVGGEMGHLDRLFLAGLIGDVVGTSQLWASIRGRRFAPAFDYRVGALSANASGVQYEVDAGYESADEIVLFEAKATTPADFLVRQLYFPYRVFCARCRKPVRLFFFNFNATSALYSFFEFRFAALDQYQSIELRASHHFRLGSAPQLPQSLDKWLSLAPDDGFEVPQADDFSKILDFPLQVAAGFDDADLMATAFDFAPRQSSYYRRACEQMGLVTVRSNRYVLTDQGREFVTQSTGERTQWMIARMLCQRVVRAALKRAVCDPNHRVTLEAVKEIIERESHLSGETVHRRAQSVRSWLRWLETTLGELRVGNKVLKLD